MATEWRTTTLGQVIELKRGYDLPSQDRRDGPYPVVSSSGISGRHSEAKAKAPGVVIGRYGTLGEVHYITEDYWPLNTSLYVRDFKGNDPKFISYFLRSLDFGAYSDKAAVPGLNRNDLHTAVVHVPPVAEQRWIAGILGALDDKIELNRRMSQTLESMARALFKSWFVDFGPVRAKAEGRHPGLASHAADLFPRSFEDSELGEIPAGWRAATIGSIADVVDCSHAKKPERLANGRPLLQLDNIRQDGILNMADQYLIGSGDYQAWTARIEASPGDCVITNVGRVGAVAQVPNDVRAALGRNMTAVRCRSDQPWPTFLVEALRSDSMRDEIVQKTDAGTILDALNVRSIPHLRLVLPKDDVLAAFEDACRPLRARMEAIERERDGLSHLLDTLLPVLLSGQVPSASVR
jgi:type I restriction enzyme S subunit